MQSPHHTLGPSRRALLLGAGAAAAASAVTAGQASAVAAGQNIVAGRTGTADDAAARLADVPIPSPDTLPLTGGPDFPIGLFWPPHPYASTPERFTEIAEAGFDFVISGNYAGDGNIFQHQLGLARTAGLKMLISDDIQIRNLSRWFSISDQPADNLSVTPAEARQLYTRARDAYGPYSSMAGFNLYDEPGAGWFGTLAKAVAISRELAPQLLPYINLFPSDDPAYYNAFVDVVKPSLVSFDRYPLLSEGREDANYFHNWAIVRAAALRAGVPAWVFIQTLAYHGHREPTAAEMLWQINISLAYGAKGIQYFTYWTPEAARGEGFGPALITVDGRRTSRYAAAKKINTTWLHPVGRQLKPLVSETVVHANETPLPNSTSPFVPTDLVTAVTGQPLVIGTFRSRDPEVTDRWLLVANRSHSTSARGALTFNPAKVTGVDVFHPISTAYAANRSATFPVSLPPGGAQLLHVHTR
ncbi:hypothetical protein Kfla_4963 [Kribbella flavida DSM 17836]|uniref:Glycoside hydrolase family 42 N-terminal domain-containing protein n=1 Tax=Kribbella flavida (strain DSM 17836 / JCM 10339 / NBRC 14399) TaxID=479435 RepID=D2Q233_KRIFD|nr:hypothetical protein [Kribbella flavida]ADB33979.1 hypothetical protein Kfla_4963 [Kribbella flavida DSM 17836]